MARYRIELTVEEANIKSVESKLRKHFGDAAATSAKKLDLAKSRAERLDSAAGFVIDARDEVESLRDEIQEWLDGVPENLQQGSKASELQECIDALESLQGELDSIDFGSVSFPGMFV